MVAYSATVELDADDMTPITDGAVTDSRGVNVGPSKIWLCASASATAPGSIAGGIPFEAGAGWDADTSFAAMFPHLGDTGYLFAYSPGRKGRVSVSHA
jgi:hypothetical protein